MYPRLGWHIKINYGVTGLKEECLAGNVGNAGDIAIFFHQKQLGEIFVGEIIMSTLKTYFLQIFCESMLYSSVIFKSIKIPDDTLREVRV